MDRNEFLKSLGTGAALALGIGCLGGCLKEDLSTSATDLPVPDGGGNPNPGGNNGVLFTIDLTSTEAVHLQSTGGYIIKNNVVIARNLNDEFVAATVICSHNLLKRVIFKNNEFYCPEHGARFNLSGKGLNKDARRGLHIYKTQLDGGLLSILS